MLGGLLTRAFGWEAVFLVNVALAGPALLLAFVLIPPDGEREKDRTFDLPGALSVTLGVTLVVFALVQGPALGWLSPGILISAVAGLLLIGAFALIERHGVDPLMLSGCSPTETSSLASSSRSCSWRPSGLCSISCRFTFRRSSATTPCGGGHGLNHGRPVRNPVRAQRHAGGWSCHRGGRRCRARPYDLAGRLVRRTDPRNGGAQYRGRRGVQHHVHRCRDGSAKPGTGHRLRNRLHGLRGRCRGRPRHPRLVATAGLDNLTGERLRIATADGISTTLFVVAGGILVTLSVAATRRPTPSTPKQAPVRTQGRRC
jgi:hypothetical protein